MPAKTAPHPKLFFFFNDTATSEIYTLPLHDALPISVVADPAARPVDVLQQAMAVVGHVDAEEVLHLRVPDLRQILERDGPGDQLLLQLEAEDEGLPRSEEHTSQLQSPHPLVCRLLLQ